MHHSDFIFISVISLAVCKHAVSTDSTNGQFAKIPLQSTPQNGTIEIQKSSNGNPETKSLNKNGDSSPKDRNYIELKHDSEMKQPTTETNNDTTSRQPMYLDIKDSKEKPNLFPKTKMSDASKQNELDALNKFKLKLKLNKMKEELKEKAEAAAKKTSFPKYFDESKTSAPKMIVDKETKKYMPFAKNSKEARDNVKRKQILEWLYNARPLLENETRLWENTKPEKSIESDKDHKSKAELQTKKDSRRSNTVHKKEVEFQTIETESKELSQAARKRSYIAMTADTASESEELTKKVAKVATNDPLESDSSMGNGLHLKPAKANTVNKAKIATKLEPEPDVAIEESIESVLKKKATEEQKKTDEKTFQRFAPMKDGSSSSESASISQ